MRIEQLAASVGSLLVKPDAYILVISGDIAYTGRRSEYDIARSFLEGLDDNLRSRLKLAPAACIIIPGNHDCDFSRQTSLRELLLRDPTPRAFDTEIIETCVEVQSQFWEFVNSIACASPVPPPGARAVFSFTAKIGDATIKFNLLNTALLSSLPERQGGLFIPLELLAPISEPSPAVPILTLSVLHHPYNWLESSNARALRRELEQSSDIILTGHEHMSDAFRVSRTRGQEIEYVEGAVFQDANDSHSSGYNIILVDTELGIQEIHHFAWNRAGRYEALAEPTSMPFIRNVQRLRNEYALHAAFEKELVDPGAHFTHSEKQTLTLDDIFVHPDLRVLTSPLEDDDGTRRMHDDLAGFLAERKHVLVLGSDRSGKTALAKTVFLDLRKRGIAPLLIRGSEIKRPDEAATKVLLEREFQIQYSAPDFTGFSQLWNSQRAIIIDDLQDIRLSSRGRQKILKHLEELFEYVLLFGDDHARFDELLDPEVENLSLWRYSACSILPFGNVKRHDIIKKWVFLGRTLTHDEEELQRQTQVIERLVSELVGRWIYPSYPLFILVVLQQLEANKRLDLNSTSGSFGFIYESILSIALARSSRLKLDLDTQYSYLAEFAYSVFRTHTPAATPAQVYEWHRAFCEAFGRRLDLSSIIESFVSAGVLVQRVDNLSFRYPYVYYYFLGRYFRDHLYEDEIRDHVTQMAARLHHEESANVLLFLTYLTKDRLILGSILDASRRLFADSPECDIERDTRFLDPLLANIPKLVVSGGDPEARRRGLLAKRDETELRDSPPNSAELIPYEDIETDDVLEDILKVNVAHKTIQMLGQILRNYPGSMLAVDKLEIAREAYSLGLRALSFMIGAVEQNKEEIVQLLHELIRKFYPEWEEERIQDHVGDLVFKMTEGLAIMTIRHVADSTGDEALAMTFDQLLEEVENVSHRFIDLSIRLSHFAQFPEGQALGLHREVHTKAFPLQLLRQLVWYHFYLHRASNELITSVCSRLGMEVSPELLYTRPKLLPAT
jgi:hypothetical protein